MAGSEEGPDLPNVYLRDLYSRYDPKGLYKSFMQ